jgi:hypothetical protein
MLFRDNVGFRVFAGELVQPEFLKGRMFFLDERLDMFRLNTSMFKDVGQLTAALDFVQGNPLPPQTRLDETIIAVTETIWVLHLPKGGKAWLASSPVGWGEFTHPGGLFSVRPNAVSLPIHKLFKEAESMVIHYVPSSIKRDGWVNIYPSSKAGIPKCIESVHELIGETSVPVIQVPLAPKQTDFIHPRLVLKNSNEDSDLKIQLFRFSATEPHIAEQHIEIPQDPEIHDTVVRGLLITIVALLVAGMVFIFVSRLIIK